MTDVSVIARFWGYFLAVSSGLSLLVITILIFVHSIREGLLWLVIGNPIAALVLYCVVWLLFYPVAAVTRRVHRQH